MSDLIPTLVKMRRERGLTQKQLADLMGVSQATVAGFEAKDSNPKMSTIRRYALAAGAMITHSVVADDYEERLVQIRKNLTKEFYGAQGEHDVPWLLKVIEQQRRTIRQLDADITTLQVRLNEQHKEKNDG